MSYIKRYENLKKFLTSQEIDFLIIDDPGSLYYLTGVQVSIGRLIICESHTRLFVDNRYIEEAQKKAHCETHLISEKAIADFIINYGPKDNKKIGFDTTSLSYFAYNKLLNFIKKIKSQHNDIEIKLVPLDEPLKDLRMIKDVEEISAMKKSAALAWKGFEHICHYLKEGVTEKELAFEYEIFCRKNGAEKLAFDPIVCFGQNSSQPHHHPDNTKLKINDIVLMDVGVVVDNYHSDLTRVIFFGQADPLLEKLYSIIKKAQNEALNICRPGTRISDLDKSARDFITEQGYGKEFLHSLGHGIGLETHEFPKIKFDGEDKDAILKTGMVITIEPGIYIAGTGGVRYEDMILITNDGYENFYTAH